MATTQNLYTGDGSAVLFSFTFPYLEESDINVTIDKATTTEYTLANATTIEFNTAPVSGSAIRISRNTDVDEVSATFFPGSAIRAQDLNDNFEQTLYVAQEVTNNTVRADGSLPMEGDLDLGGFDVVNGGAKFNKTVDLANNRITNLQAPSASTDAANREYVDNKLTGGDRELVSAAYAYYTATQGDTVVQSGINGSDYFAVTPGLEQVYVNGALQQKSVDYSATSSQITFTQPLLQDDVVAIHCINNVNVSALVTDTYTYSGGVQQTVQARLEQYVSTSDFGCSQDGSTNDLVKLNAAIAEARTSNKALSIIGTVAFDGEFSDLPDLYKISYTNGGRLRDVNGTVISFDRVDERFEISVDTVEDLLQALDFAQRCTIESGGHLVINVDEGVYNFTETITIISKPGVSILGKPPAAAQTSHQVKGVVYQGVDSYNTYTRQYKYTATISVPNASAFAIGDFVVIKKRGAEDIQLNGVFYGGWEITGVSGDEITFDWYYPETTPPGFSQDVDEASYVFPLKTVFKFPTGMTAFHAMGSYQSADYNFIFTIKDLAIFTPEVNQTGSTDVFGLVADHGSSMGFNGSGNQTAVVFSGFRRALYALNTSSIRGAGVIACNNGTGIFAQGMCSINAIKAYLISNDYATVLGYGANLTITGSHVYSSARTGLNAQNFSVAVADGSYIRYNGYANIYAEWKAEVSCKSAYLRQLSNTEINVFGRYSALIKLNDSELTGGTLTNHYLSICDLTGTTLTDVAGSGNVEVFKGSKRTLKSREVIAAGALNAGETLSYTVPFQGATASAVDVIYLANCNSTLPAGVVIDVRCVTTDEIQLTTTNTTSSTVGAFTRSWTFVLLDYT